MYHCKIVILYTVTDRNTVSSNDALQKKLKYISAHNIE